MTEEEHREFERRNGYRLLEQPPADPIDAQIHHNARVVNARIAEIADKFLGLQPAESTPLDLLARLERLLEGN